MRLCRPFAAPPGAHHLRTGFTQQEYGHSMFVCGRKNEIGMNLNFRAAPDIANVAAHRHKQKPALDAPHIKRWRIQPPAQIQESYD
jgi:hypothetical protein